MTKKSYKNMKQSGYYSDKLYIYDLKTNNIIIDTNSIVDVEIIDVQCRRGDLQITNNTITNDFDLTIAKSVVNSRKKVKVK